MVLTQERLGDKDPWKVLVCCIMLNRTRGEQSEPVIQELLSRWPDASTLAKADDSLEQLIAPLGLTGRAKQLRQLSKILVSTDPQTREEVEGLPGCGEYAADAWEMLIRGRRDFWPRDSKLGPRMLELRLDLKTVRDFHNSVYIHLFSGTDGATLLGMRHDKVRDLVRVPYVQFHKEFRPLPNAVPDVLAKWIEYDEKHYISLTERGRRITMSVLAIIRGKVTKFADVESATAAAPAGSKVVNLDEAELGGLTLAVLVELYNEIVPEAKRVKTFKDKETAVKRVIKAGEAVKNPDPAGATSTNRARIAETDVITILVDKNPKRPTAQSYKTFELYRNGMTVKEAIEAGIPRADLSWDSRHEFIKIAPPQAAQA